MKLDKRSFSNTRPLKVNPNTHQKFDFYARLQMAAGVALHICPALPGTVS